VAFSLLLWSMTMKKDTKALAITEAAKQAANQLALWDKVEASAKKALEQAQERPANGNLAEFHFRTGPDGTEAKGVVVIGSNYFKFEG